MSRKVLLLWALALLGFAFGPSGAWARGKADNARVALERVTPESRGMDAATLSKIDGIIEGGIAEGLFPGAVVSVVKDGGIVFLKAYGNRQVVPDTLAMTEETLFDLASVSKCVGMTLSFMQILEQGRVHLDDRVDSYFPNFRNWEDPVSGETVPITVQQLLTHSSGLPPQVFAEDYVKRYGANTPDTLMRRVISTEIPRLFRPGSAYRYSCLNFITLQHILEQVTGQRLCDYAQHNVFDVLGLTHTCYFPLAGEPQSNPRAESLRKNVAATEVQSDGKPLVAAVHDPTARFVQAGNSGNAGVFSNAEDLSIIAAAILNGGEWKGRRILKEETVERMLSIPVGNAPVVGRVLGWDTYLTRSGIAGSRFDRRYLVGHTGYTGTMMLLDPATKTAVIVLTNRVHPEDKGNIRDIRVAVSDLVAASLGLKDSREEVLADPAKAGGLMYVYDYNAEAAMTPAPKGYKPFYISHYGRHGTRYLLAKQYKLIEKVLTRAEKEGLLTERGERLFREYKPFHERAVYCSGDLSEKGIAQQRIIADRMYRRFPEVFKGDTKAAALSTPVPRVIMSMTSFIDGLQERDKTFTADENASEAFSPILRPNFSPLADGRPDPVEKMEAPFVPYFRETVDVQGILGRIFKDPAAAVTRLKMDDLNFIRYLFDLDNGRDCLDGEPDLCEGIFTLDDKIAIARVGAYRISLFLGRYKDSGSYYPDFSAYTLKDIIDKADADIASGQCQLRLRFSHDSAVMPTVVFMNINGYGREATSPEEAFDIFPLWNMPMGGSLQLIFYRSRKSPEILVKALWHEPEAVLPFAAAPGPYYRWSDFKAYYESAMEASFARIRAMGKTGPANTDPTIQY